MEGGGVTLYGDGIMESGSAPSALLLDGLGKKQMEAKRKEDEERERLEYYIEELREHDEGECTKTMPPSGIVKYNDLVAKAWGWNRLLPYTGVPWSDYSKYLGEYYLYNARQLVPGAAATTGSSIAGLAEICLKKEEQLASEWKIRMNSKMDKMDMILPSKSIILSCLIQERARSVIHAAGCKFSDVSSAALLCIAKEADLMCELLRRGASPDDYLIDQSSEIRMCALSLMNCTSCHSVAASAAMLGLSKEAETMCKWMSDNNMLLDIFDVIPEELADGRRVRFLTLYVMIDILEKSSSSAAGIDTQESASRNGPGGDGNGIAADEAATITGISDVLDSQDLKKIKDLKISGDFLEKAWGWERLVPLYDSSLTWSDYSSYLVEYYNRNAFKIVAEAAGNQNPDWPLDPADQAVATAVAKSCLEMEEQLLSEWKTHVTNIPDDILPVNTLIQSSLIKERALSILRDKPFVPSTIAFVCITKEADLTHELLKHGAKPTDDMIEQSSVIRMCALGLVNLNGYQSIASAAAMVGLAKEAKMMCDWMKRENKLLTFSVSEHPELEVGRFIRNRMLDVMISILHESSFPSSKNSSTRRASTTCWR